MHVGHDDEFCVLVHGYGFDSCVVYLVHLVWEIQLVLGF
jgi:hypothetical protein